MQPPSEADVIAATESLKRQKLALDGQIAALGQIALLLESQQETGDSPLAIAAGNFVTSYRASQLESSYALGAAITHNERALQAYRSGIILPTHIQRKPSN